MPTNVLPAISLPVSAVQPRRLLDEIDHFNPIESGNMRWMQGVTWRPYVCRTLTVDTEATCTGDTLNVTADICATWAHQAPFRISDAFTASMLQYAESEVEDHLIMTYNRLLSAAFAHELIAGTGSGDRSLSSVATAPTDHAFGAAVTVRRAMAAIETEIARRLQGTVGYIHVPPGMLAEAVYAYGVRLNSEDDWETPAGNIVISDAGYTDSVQPTGQAATVDGTDWIYASGPVFYETTAPVLLDVGTTRFTHNTFSEYIAGYGILVFDSCPVTAVLASYGTG